MSFADILASAAGDALIHLGESFTHNGIQYTGIPTDEEFIDETGIKKVVKISVSINDSKLFRRGETLTYQGQQFRISKIPPIDGPLVDLEVKLV